MGGSIGRGRQGKFCAGVQIVGLVGLETVFI